MFLGVPFLFFIEELSFQGKGDFFSIVLKETLGDYVSSKRPRTSGVLYFC